MQVEKVIDFVRGIGGLTAVYRREWNGYSVYEPIYDPRESDFEESSSVVLVSGDGEIRFATPDENTEFLDRIESDYRS